MFLVRLRTMLKNRIRVLLVQREIEPPPVSDLFGQVGNQGPELPKPDGRLLREDVELVEVLQEKIRSTEGLTPSFRREKRRRVIPGACRA